MLVTNAEGIEILTILCNIIISKREFPEEWKTALIKPVCTGKGNQREPREYRKISLLRVLGKISIFRNNNSYIKRLANTL
jgi:hypothetical protein